MNGRRVGCLAFGLIWVGIFMFTNVGRALGHPLDRTELDPLAIAFWVELAILIAGIIWFYRAEMKDGDY